MKNNDIKIGKVIDKVRRVQIIWAVLCLPLIDANFRRIPISGEHI
jgi:hypothetical protein